MSDGLREVLVARFNLEELETLAFDAGIPYEELDGGTLGAKARALVAYARRHGLLEHLQDTIRKTRPDVAIPAALPPATRAAIAFLSDMAAFSQLVAGRPLRAYQLDPARSIVGSVLRGEGKAFAVMMCRQAGKNELSAQLEAYLLNLYQRKGGQIVKASPTFKPQTLNSVMRLRDRLDNPWNRGRYRSRAGYILELGRARALFFSAEPSARVVGATADLLLECDEAQDVSGDKWQKDFVPMAASTNATRVFWGTAWTRDTLLAQTFDHLRTLERRDGIKRTWRITADQVAAEVPAYGEFVRSEEARYGRDHPLVKTQYYLEEIDQAGGLFSPLRQALMRGDHERRHEPVPGARYALLVDVAGEDEAAGDAVSRAMLANARRDATAVTVVEVGTTHASPLPLYRVVDRCAWLGVRHTTLHERIAALITHWHAVWVVVDATSVGAGLASFLTRSFGDHRDGGRVIPLVFSSRVKSDLGWGFVALVETGRYRDYSPDGDVVTDQFWYEVGACQYEVGRDAGHTLRWGVWEPAGYDGRIARGHDDLLVSAAMCAVLDQQAWPGVGASGVVEVGDVLDGVDARGGW